MQKHVFPCGLPPSFRAIAAACWLWFSLAPALTAAEPPTAASASARELGRLGIYGGAGYANEHASDGMYGAAALRLTAFLPANVTAELLVETLSSYDRNYSS